MVLAWLRFSAPRSNRLDPRKKPKLGPSDRSDTPADRPGEPGTDTDSGGTGERPTVGKVPEPRDAGADRVVNSQEAGLGGKTDEEIARERKGRG